MSDSETHSSSKSSEEPSEHAEVDNHEDVEELEFFLGNFEPYEDEPVGRSSDEEEQNEADEDGLTPAVLESRFERQVPVDSWCSCGRCRNDSLESALEFRCCREIDNAVGKLVFDGSIERLSCVTEHEDYVALTHRAVLAQVAPLLKDRNGRGYRRRAGHSENEFLRAVAYRWIIRWICGYMGWENTRPLPACIYHEIRQRFPSHQTRGYASAQDRE